VAFSAGGDGGGKSPEHPAQSAHVVCGSHRLPNKSRFISGTQNTRTSWQTKCATHWGRTSHRASTTH